MNAKIVNSCIEKFPRALFVGNRYTDEDRVDGAFGAKWGEWFSQNKFSVLENLPQLEENGDAYIGAMRVLNGKFEYWIGMFMPENTVVPDGYEFITIESTNYAVFWLYGNEQNGEIFGLDNHNMCLGEMDKQGLQRLEDNWCFERYNCPRYTTPDDKGNVILDYGISFCN